VSGLLSNAALIVATAQLEVTTLLISAMRTADLASRPTNSPFDVGAPDRNGPAAIVDFRHSTCCHEVRPNCSYKINKNTRSILDSPYPANTGPTRPALQPNIPRAAELCHPLSVSPTESPIQPPWKVLPWENPPQPLQTVKIHSHPTDVVQKGMLLDLFV
jgi:hypothetical protein